MHGTQEIETMNNAGSMKAGTMETGTIQYGIIRPGNTAAETMNERNYKSKN